MNTTDPIQSLRDEATRRRREADISGPNDRAELIRLAMRDERLANQLECETVARIRQASKQGHGASYR
jgi:hypothetical protein